MNVLHTSHVEAVIDSTRPEDELITERRALALHIKYHREITHSWEYTNDILRSASLVDASEADLTPQLKSEKHLGGIMVEWRDELPVTAHDTDYQAQVMRGEAGIMLHVEYINGPRHFLGQLELAGNYIAANYELLEMPYVMGVSFRELGRFAVAVAGMRTMEITSAEADYADHAQAAHMAFCALNGGKPREFEMAAVYLPTDEFVAKFAATPDA